MKKEIVLVIALISTLFLTQCGKTSQSGSEASNMDKAKLEEFVESEFEYPIPTSYEVTNMLEKAEANFVFNITNDPNIASQYVAMWQKAMVLGVYGADLSYASTYNRNEETMLFMKACRQLVEELNISTAFTPEMLSRMERNIDNKDSLILIVTESIYESYNYLNKNGEEKTSLLVIAGSVVEGLHITSQLIIGSNYNENLLEVLANQKDEVKQLVELMEAHADDENVNRVLPKLRFIDLFYDQLGESTTITKGQFEDIYSSIKDIRQTIVG